jgi:hypothetical protein
MSTTLSVPTDKCWERIGRWEALHEWHPAVAKTELDGEGIGSHRTLTLGDGATIKERLDAQSDSSYEYSFVEHPLPVDDYHGKISVVDNGDGTTTVHWGSNFVATDVSDEQAREIISGIYQAGFDALHGEFKS